MMEESPTQFFAEWKDLQLQEIWHPNLQFYLRIFMDFIFLTSVIIYSFTSFIVIKKSTTKMGKFRYTVLAQMTFNIIYEFAIFYINPIMHWPLPLISANSHFPINRQWFFELIGFVFFVVIGGIFAFMLSLTFRVMAAFPSGTSLTSSRISYICCGILFISIVVTSEVPIYFIPRDPNELQQLFEADLPILTQLYKILPVTIGIHPALSNGWLTVLLSCLCAWLIFDSILLLGLNITFIYRLKRLAKRVSKDTLALHKMLHRALLIQLFGAILFAVVPVALLFITFLLQLRYGSWISNFAFPLSSFHVIFDSCCLLYFVKPYRKFISKRIFKTTVVVHTTHFHSIHSHY